MEQETSVAAHGNGAGGQGHALLCALFSTPPAYALPSTPDAAGRRETARPGPTARSARPCRAIPPLIELLRPEQRAWLRRVRRRIANRELMRHTRADINRKLLCPGVDLPIEAGTCGRLVWPESSRCIYCHNRRTWLLKYGH